MTLECIDPNLLLAAVRFDKHLHDAASGLADPLDRTSIPEP
jgi:hypothetical protein